MTPGEKCVVIFKTGKEYRYFVKIINGMYYFANSKTMAKSLARGHDGMVKGMQHIKNFYTEGGDSVSCKHSLNNVIDEELVYE